MKELTRVCFEVTVLELDIYSGEADSATIKIAHIMVNRRSSTTHAEERLLSLVLSGNEGLLAWRYVT